MGNATGRFRWAVAVMAMCAVFSARGQDQMLLGGATATQGSQSPDQRQPTIQVERRAFAVRSPADANLEQPPVAGLSAPTSSRAGDGDGALQVPSTMSEPPAGAAPRAPGVPAVGASDVAAFAGGLPAAYVEVAREIDARIRDHARTSAEARARVQGSFGALGIDFGDTERRARARDEMNSKLGLIAYYSGAMGTLAKAVDAKSKYRTAQARALISEAESLADLHGALDGLGRRGVEADGEAYALAAFDPPRLFLSHDAAVFPVRVRALASPVSVESAHMLVDGAGAVAAAVHLDATQCKGVLLDLGDDCLLMLHYDGLSTEVRRVPGGFVSVGLVSDAVAGEVRQSLAVRFGALPTPPQARLRLDALESAAGELQVQTREAIGALETTLASQLGTFSAVVERMVAGTEARLVSVEAHSGEAVEAVEAVGASTVQLKQLLDAEIEARKDMEGRFETLVVAGAQQAVEGATEALLEQFDRRVPNTIAASLSSR